MRSLNQGGSLRRAPETGTPNASAAGVYDRRLNVYNLKPYHLRRTRAALAKARAGTGRCVIATVGDSTTGGVGSGNVGVNDWPAQLGSMLSTAGYPLAGSGIAAAWKASANDARWGTIPGAWGPLSGWDNLLLNSTTADPLVFTSTNAATTVNVYYANSGGPFTVSIDNSTPVTVTPVGGSTRGVYSVTGLDSKTHAVSIVRSSGNAQIFGVEVGVGNGVCIMNAGIGGQKINTSPVWYTAETICSSSAGFNADLVTLMMETNDAGVTATATYKASVQGVITAIKNNGSDLVLITAVPSSGKDFTAFNQALYELADANDIPLIDLQDRMGTYALSNGYGLMSDTLHPNATGYTEVATAIFSVLGQSGAVTGAQIAADPALVSAFVGQSKKGQSAIETQRSFALEPWFAALANRDNAPAKWLAIGDSITEGMGASTNLNRWTQRSLTGLRNRFATTGLTGGGFGFLPSHYDSTSMGQPYSASSGTPTLNTDFGIGRRTAQMSGTQSYTYTITCSSFDVWYVSPTTTGTIGVQIDGGSVTSVNTTGGTILDGNVWNSGALTPGAHTVVISVVAGTTYFGGISVYNGDESKGVRLYEAGHFGWTTGNWLTNSNWWPRTVNTIQPHLVTIALATNDINAGVTPATVFANLNSLITSIRSQITVPPAIVLVAYPARTDITPTYPWQSYVDQMHKVAASDSLISVLDLSVRMSNPSNTAIATWNADKVHPVDKGHALIADMFTGFISPK